MTTHGQRSVTASGRSPTSLPGQRRTAVVRCAERFRHGVQVTLDTPRPRQQGGALPPPPLCGHSSALGGVRSGGRTVDRAPRPCPGGRRQPRRAVDLAAARLPRGAAPAGRAAPGDGGPPARRLVPPADRWRSSGASASRRRSSRRPPREFVQNGAIVSVESLAAPDMKFFFRHFNEGVEQLSPTSRLFITQIGLEPLLRHRAGARRRAPYATELVGFEQDDDGVTAVIRPRDGGAEETVRARLPGRRRRRAQPGPGALRHRPGRPRLVRRLRDHLLPGRHAARCSATATSASSTSTTPSCSASSGSPSPATPASSPSSPPRAGRQPEPHVARTWTPPAASQLVRKALGRAPTPRRDRHRAALDRGGGARRAVPRRAGLPRRRRRARHAADRRVRRQHRRRGRAQPGVEAGHGARAARPAPACSTATTPSAARLRPDRRAGVHPLRAAGGSLAAPGEPGAASRRPSIELGTVYRSAAVLAGDDDATLVDPRKPAGRLGRPGPAPARRARRRSDLAARRLRRRLRPARRPGRRGRGAGRPSRRPPRWVCRCRPTASGPTATWSTPTAPSPARSASAATAPSSPGPTACSPGGPRRRRPIPRAEVEVALRAAARSVSPAAAGGAGRGHSRTARGRRHRRPEGAPVVGRPTGCRPRPSSAPGDGAGAPA